MTSQQRPTFISLPRAWSTNAASVDESEPCLARLIFELAGKGNLTIHIDQQSGSATMYGGADRQPAARTVVRRLLRLVPPTVDHLFLTGVLVDGQFAVGVHALDAAGRSVEDVMTIGGERGMLGFTVEDLVDRAATLARGMAEKTAIAAESSPNLAGTGKKGTFAVFDANGRSLPESGLSTHDLVGLYAELAAVAIPRINAALLGREPTASEIWPVSSSPDMWTGPNWPALANAMLGCGLPRAGWTCKPGSFGGFTVPSSTPTADGVFASLAVLMDEAGLNIAETVIFIDGGGGVTCDLIPILLEAGADTARLHVAEPNADRARQLEARFPGLRVCVGPTNQVLESGTVDQLDVLIVNGPGDQLGVRQLELVQQRGVRVIGGGANSFFKLDEEEACAALLASNGVLCVPSPLANMGGWVLAACGQLAEAAGCALPPLEPMVRDRTRALAAAATRAALDTPGPSYEAGLTLIRSRLSGVRARSVAVRTPVQLLADLLDVEVDDLPIAGRDGWESANTESAENLWGDEPVPCLSAIVEAFRAHGVKNVLDIGYGSGRNVEGLLCAGFVLSGLDLSASAHATATRRLASVGLIADLRVGDMHDLSSFAATELDAVTYLDCLGQVPDPVAALRTGATVLQPGGLVAANLFTPRDATYGEGEQIDQHAFVYRNTLFQYYEPEAALELFRAAGFEVLHQEVVRWTDEPHGTFRPEPHEHENTIVIARVPRHSEEG